MLTRRCLIAVDSGQTVRSSRKARRGRPSWGPASRLRTDRRRHPTADASYKNPHPECPLKAFARLPSRIVTHPPTGLIASTQGRRSFVLGSWLRKRLEAALSASLDGAGMTVSNSRIRPSSTASCPAERKPHPTVLCFRIEPTFSPVAAAKRPCRYSHDPRRCIGRERSDRAPDILAKPELL
jgi:hypothetical protein